MSAIWGAIDLNGKKIPEEIQKGMRKSVENCVLDDIHEICRDNVYMGCGIQYFTKEARNEKMPLISQDVYYTADVVLDNCDELLDKLGFEQKHNESMPDGEILFQMYKRFGKSCENDLLGAYTFVWYDKNKQQVDICLDAVGNRCLYYKADNNIVYFSSLLESFYNIGQSVEPNEKWFVDFLAMDHLFMFNEEEETLLKNVYRVAPAQHVEITPDGIKKEIYWKPFEQFKEYHYKNDEQYKKEFCKIWKKAVESVIRTETDTSILLSGGLDSTSVAAVAAPFLKKKGKKLYSYTSIPAKGYRADNSGYYIEDETEDVKKTAEYYGNIDMSYIDLDDKDCWELAKYEADILEMPYKSIQNSEWIEQSLRKAYKKGSRLMLNGSYGNIAISYTDLNVYMNTLCKKGKFITLLKEINAFGNNMGFSKRYALEQILKDTNTHFKKSDNPYKKSFVNRELADSLGTKERIYEIDRNVYEASCNFEKQRKTMVDFLAFRQIGEITTKHTLKTGVLIRDPSKDKRIIEFCAHLPMEQFCKNGMDRRLIKVYLKDMIPPHVIRFSKQGRQSADLQYRISKKWDTIRQEWIDFYEKHADSKYVDVKRALDELNTNAEIKYYKSYDLVRHIYTILVLRYLDMMKKQASE